jgi:calcium-dependent protein kinase
VWSVGVIAYMLLSGIPPFYGTTDSETLVSIKTGEWQFDEYLFNSVSPEAKDFISKCLTRRPFWRPSAASALKHKWFKSMLPKREPLPSINIIHRFSTFIVRPTLSKIFMDVVAHTLLPEQVTELREQFNKFDVSNSGAITLQDLRAIMRQFKGFREDYLNVIIASLDLDQKGKIGYHEFLAATIRRQNVAEENLQIAFEIVSNHSEYITSADVAALLGGSNFELGQIMEEAGLDLDAKISFHGVSVAYLLLPALCAQCVHWSVSVLCTRAWRCSPLLVQCRFVTVSLLHLLSLRNFCLFVVQFKAILDGEEEGQSHLDSFDEHMD